MQYICIKDVKGFIFKKFRVDDIITVKNYNDLTAPEKLCFTVDYSDDSFWEQIERNQQADDKADKN